MCPHVYEPGSTGHPVFTARCIHQSNLYRQQTDRKDSTQWKQLPNKNSTAVHEDGDRRAALNVWRGQSRCSPPHLIHKTSSCIVGRFWKIRACLWQWFEVTMQKCLLCFWKRLLRWKWGKTCCTCTPRCSKQFLCSCTSRWTITNTAASRGSWLPDSPGTWWF